MSHFAQTAPVPEAPVNGGISGGLSISLFEDVLNAALLTATTSSIATSLSTTRPASLSLASLVSCLPPIPIAYSMVMARLDARPQDQPLMKALSDFIEALAAAREFSQLVSHSGVRGRDRLPTGITLLAADWRRVAAFALTLIAHIEAAFGHQLQSPLPERIDLAVNLLTAVCRGEAPCVNRMGRIELPEPFERRAAARTNSGRHATVFVGDGIQKPLVLNVSPQGMGVFGLAGVKPGDLVTLLAGPGLQAKGKIAWLEGGQAGIQFDSPLPEPVLASLIN